MKWARLDAPDEPKMIGQLISPVTTLRQGSPSAGPVVMSSAAARLSKAGALYAAGDYAATVALLAPLVAARHEGGAPNGYA